MRFKCKPKHQQDDVRIIERFLIFPKKLNDEVRWLEKAKIKQVFNIEKRYCSHINDWMEYEYWEDLMWI